MSIQQGCEPTSAVSSFFPSFLEWRAKCNVQVRQDEERKTSHRIDASSGRRRDSLKIERQSDGKNTIIQLIGRIRAEHLEEIKRQIGTSPEPTILDLSEVTIVDADVIRFLSAIELERTQLVGCPPYIREWIMRERAEGAS